MSATSLSIVPVYAAVLAILYLALTFAVIRNRYRLRVSLGDGGDKRLNRVIRGAWKIFRIRSDVVAVAGLRGIGGAGAVVIHLGGALLLSGRLLHGYALALTLQNISARRNGMILTLASIVVGIGACFSLSLGA